MTRPTPAQLRALEAMEALEKAAKERELTTRLTEVIDRALEGDYGPNAWPRINEAVDAIDAELARLRGVYERAEEARAYAERMMRERNAAVQERDEAREQGRQCRDREADVAEACAARIDDSRRFALNEAIAVVERHSPCDPDLVYDIMHELRALRDREP